jgi:hypothetical protein
MSGAARKGAISGGWSGANGADVRGPSAGTRYRLYISF